MKVGATLKRVLHQAVFIVLDHPSIEVLLVRLEQRQTESTFDLTLRTKTAETEIKHLPLFDYIVINKQGELNLAVSEINAIITAEKCRLTRGEIAL